MSQRRPSRRRTTRSRAHSSASREGSASTTTTSSLSSSPSPLDRSRYRLFRTGLSPAEIATREKVRLDAVEKSILRCRVELQQYSQEEAEAATRRVYMDLLPAASQAMLEAARAEKTENRSITCSVEDPETKQILEQTKLVEVQVPDHDTRLKGVSALRQLLQSVQPKTPMVQVDARSQTNNLGLPPGMGGGLQLGAGSSSPSPTSAEAIIRAIRQERGLALTDGAVAATHSGPVAARGERDEELEDDLALTAEEGDYEEESTDEAAEETAGEEDDNPSGDPPCPED